MKKSPGTEAITTEMHVAACDIGITERTKLANMVYIHITPAWYAMSMGVTEVA